MQELPTEVFEEKTALIRHLQTQLRNEEMSLVLLKKIRQSQVLAEQAKEAAAKASLVGLQQPQSQGVNSVGNSMNNSVVGSVMSGSGANASGPGSVTNSVNSRSQSSHHQNRGTPPPMKSANSRQPVNSNTGLPGLTGLGGINSTHGRGGNNATGNSHSGHKNVLTPDLSLLKPVSVVSLKNSLVSLKLLFLIILYLFIFCT